ncbi:DUF397 domain-containing protein [Streptomyces sp. NPDC048696]|uniref:DUF397 domain-containing protein n=1 Tax=Streptomyces sp. NPDC048696 TaxID=3365585 RepID=UPI0037186F81
MSKHIPDSSALGVAWIKSSYSGGNSDCVETARLNAALLAIRDSKRPTGPALVFGRAAIQDFVDGIRGGEHARSSFLS